MRILDNPARPLEVILARLNYLLPFQTYNSKISLARLASRPPFKRSPFQQHNLLPFTTYNSDTSSKHLRLFTVLLRYILRRILNKHMFNSPSTIRKASRAHKSARYQLRTTIQHWIAHLLVFGSTRSYNSIRQRTAHYLPTPQRRANDNTPPKGSASIARRGALSRSRTSRSH